MDIKETINSEFNKYIDYTFKKPDIRNFLKNHERRHILVSNLKQNIDEASHVLLPLNKTQEEKRKIIKDLTVDFVKLFCRTALDVKEAEITNAQSHTIENSMKNLTESGIIY